MGYNRETLPDLEKQEVLYVRDGVEEGPQLPMKVQVSHWESHHYEALQKRCGGG